MRSGDAINYSALESQLLQIRKSGSFDALAHVVPGVELDGFQCVSLLLWLYSKNALVQYDTGMGKSYFLGAGIYALKLLESRTKCLLFATKSQLTQTAKDLRSFGLRVVSSTAESAQLNAKLMVSPERYDVLMLTHETLNLDTVCAHLLHLVDNFTILAVDECQAFSNLEKSDRTFFLRALARRIPRVAFMSATPLFTRSEQFLTVLSTMSDEFERVDRIGKLLRKGERIDKIYPFRIYNYSRKEVGAWNTLDTYVHWVDSHEFQRALPSTTPHYLNRMRAEGAESQARELMRLLMQLSAEGKRGLVYVYYKDVREWVVP